jgi:hypothetical protein
VSVSPIIKRILKIRADRSACILSSDEDLGNSRIRETRDLIDSLKDSLHHMLVPFCLLSCEVTAVGCTRISISRSTVLPCSSLVTLTFKKITNYFSRFPSLYRFYLFYLNPYVLYLVTLSARTVQRRVTGLVNSELERMWKEAIVG